MSPRALAALALLCAPRAWPQDPVIIGETVQRPSVLLKETRTLYIAKPAGNDRYPVLYLLDADEYFRFTATIVDFLSANDRMPKMLVVGIASGSQAQRTRDLTPPSTAETDNRFSPGGGGAETFLQYLAAELIPYVEQTYRTRPYRLLAGHSFGGLFAVYALVTRPSLFQGYIAADPSLYWNHQAVVAQAESFLSQTQSLPADLYLTATDLAGQPSAEIERLRAALAKSVPTGFCWHFDWMPRENHMSIPLPALYRGLETIFDPWRLSDPIAVFNQGGIEAIHRRFQDAGKRFGYPERTTPAFQVSLVVAALLRAGRLDDAANVLLHDPKTYPPPRNQLDALARAYDTRGDTAQAARYRELAAIHR